MKLRRGLKRLLKSILLLICAAALLVIYMRYVEPRRLEVTHFEMTSGGQELRIAAFGDTHIGMGNDAPELEKLVREINDRRPDVVVFLGDLFDDLSTYQGDSEKCMEILSGIEAEHKYAVRGNHDVGGGAEWAYPGLIGSAGFTLLENASAELPCGINLIGAADSTYFTADIDRFVTDGFDILLSHEPDPVAGTPGVELQLSGHSHGGQVHIPFVMDRILPDGAKKYYRGAYEKPDGGIIYVNRGFGMSLVPMRLFSRPELTVIDIKGE